MPNPTNTILKLVRLRDTGTATFGILTAHQGDKVILKLMTLEPSWFFNLTDVSCIPTGRYEMVKRESPKYGRHLWLKDVKGRSMILIHAGNFYGDTAGCILVGRKFAYIDDDGHLDVSESRSALNELLSILPDSCNIEIRDHEHKQYAYASGGNNNG